MSLLVPDGSFGSGVIESFCHFVHFFASQQAGQRWAAGYSGNLLMTLGEAASFKPTSRRSSHLRPGQDRPGAYRTPGRALQGLCPGGTGFRHPQGEGERISQPRHDPAELLLFGEILPGGNHPEQPRHDGTPRPPALLRDHREVGARPHRRDEFLVFLPRPPRPRRGKRSITGTLGSRSGGHARVMLPSAATPQEASCRDRHRPAASWKECALTTPIPSLLRRDGPVPHHEHRGSTITTRMPGVCKRSPRICKVPMWR